MAAAQLHSQHNGHEVLDLGVRQVVDVVVLGDDVAIPLGLGPSTVDGSMDLEDHSLLARPELLVLVWDLDQGRLTLGGPMHEFPTVIAVGNVTHEVEALARLAESPFQCIVIVRRDDQLASAELVRVLQPSEQPGKELVQQANWVICIEHMMQLLIQWSRPTHDIGVLGDTHEIERFVLRIVKSLGEMTGELSDAWQEGAWQPGRPRRASAEIHPRAKERDDPALGHRLGHPTAVVLKRFRHGPTLRRNGTLIRPCYWLSLQDSLRYILGFLACERGRRARP